jgi:7-keto-8-aminopelargonate synthetase-like enzyme
MVMTPLHREQRRARLAQLTRYLRDRLQAAVIQRGDSPAPIFAFQLGDRAVMAALQQRLFERGIYVMISNYIGSGADGIVRCAVFTDHSEADIDSLVEGIERFKQGRGGAI